MSEHFEILTVIWLTLHNSVISFCYSIRPLSWKFFESPTRLQISKDLYTFLLHFLVSYGELPVIKMCDTQLSSVNPTRPQQNTRNEFRDELNTLDVDATFLVAAEQTSVPQRSITPALRYTLCSCRRKGVV